MLAHALCNVIPHGNLVATSHALSLPFFVVLAPEWTADELLLTHLVFEGVFNDLSVEQCVALLSCFVFQDKSSGDVKLKEVSFFFFVPGTVVAGLTWSINLFLYLPP